MPGGFVPYHHSTGKKYKNPGYTSGGSKSGGTGTGSATYGSPSNPYVPSGSSSSTSYSGSSSSSSSAAAAKAVAQAQAAVKAAKAVVSEYGKDKKNPKSVSGKYAKATEKAKKKREKSKKAVKKKTAEVEKKYASPKKSPAPAPDPKLLTAGILKNVSAYATPVNDKKVAEARKKTTAYFKKPEGDRGRYPTVKVHGTAYDAYNVAKAHDPKHVYSEDAPPISLKRYAKDRAKEIKSYSRQAATNPRKAVQRRSDRLYDLAQTVSGLPGPAPKVVLSPDTATRKTAAGKEGVAGYVMNGNDRVHVSPDIWNDLAIRGLSPETTATMFHEFAHTKQNAKTLSKSGRAEGLATRFENTVGRRTGLERDRNAPTKEYHGYRKSVGKAPRKTVLRGQFKGNAYKNYQIPEAGRPSGKKYTDVPEFGPGNAYKIWEGANRIAAKAKELSKGKTGKAETEATRNAARAAEALSRAVTGREAAGPKPRKVANRLEKAVRKAGPDTSVYKDLGPVAPQLAEAAVKYGKEFGIDPSFLMAIAEIESGFGAAAGSGTPGAGAVSSAGAQGYMQFMPASRDTVLRETGYDAFSNDPKEAMAAAAAYFSVFAPDAQSNYDRAFSYNHAGWYANDVVKRAKKYTALDNAEVSNVPTQIKRTARQTLGKRPTKAILQGGKVVRDPDAEGTGPVQVDSARDQVRAGAIQKPSPKEDKYFSYDHETDRAWFDPILQKQLIALAKASGEPIQLNSGFRTLAEQKAAYADYQAGGALAATPGSSNHEFGLAADLQLTDKQRSMLGEFGLGLPVPGEDWHVEVEDPKLKAQQSAVNLGTAGGSATVTGDSPNIPIQGTNLAVKVPLPTTTGTPSTGGTTYSGGTSSTGAPVPGTPEYQQMMNEVRRRRGPSVSKRLAAIDRWMTSPITAPTPEISQELIDRILGK